MIAINLLPQVYVARRRAKHRLRSWGVATVLLASAYAIATTTYLASQRSGGGDASARIAAVEARLSRSRQEIARSGAVLRAKLAEQAAAHAVGTHPDYSVLLRWLSVLREGQVALESLAVTTTDGAPAAKGGKPGVASTVPASIRLELSGLARTPSAAAGYVIRMEKTGLFSKVELLETSPRPPGPARAVEATGFKVRATFAGGVDQEKAR